MRSKESKKSAYGKAKRFLSKARDFYVKSMMDLDGKFPHSNMMPCPGPQVPTFFGASLIRKKNDEINKELYRSISMKNVGSTAALDDRTERVHRSYSVGVDRCYSIRIGRIGTIDEEEPCEFREEEITIKSEISEILFPRSRSCAVVKRNGYH